MSVSIQVWPRISLFASQCRRKCIKDYSYESINRLIWSVYFRQACELWRRDCLYPFGWDIFSNLGLDSDFSLKPESSLVITRKLRSMAYVTAYRIAQIRTNHTPYILLSLEERLPFTGGLVYDTSTPRNVGPSLQQERRNWALPRASARSVNQSSCSETFTWNYSSKYYRPTWSPTGEQ